MSSGRCLVVGALSAALIAVASAAVAGEMIQYDAYCPKDGAALRQTIVIIDDSVVHHAPPGEPPPAQNATWVQPLQQIADVGPAAFGTMMPGELLTVFIARRDTIELVPIFHGCSANLSAADEAALQEGQSLISKFLLGTKSSANRRKEFEDALTDAYGLLIREERTSVSDKTDPTQFFAAVASAQSLFSLDNGIPRVLLITPFGGLSDQWRTVAEARAAGFAAAADTKIDMSRAEVYVIASQGNGQIAQNFADAFLLKSRARLAGWRQTGLPPLENPPQDVQVFGGEVNLAGINAPVQMRLAVDAQGTLVNSWIELTRLTTSATPITGKMICSGDAQCTVKGDGKLLAQVWSNTPLEPAPGSESMFRSDLPWSGFRQVEITIKGEGAEAWIFEPNVELNVVSGPDLPPETIKGYRVPTTLTKGLRF